MDRLVVAPFRAGAVRDKRVPRHLLGDFGAAVMLGRITWATAYQRRDRTMFVVDQRHPVANPFDADLSVPFAITCAGLGTLERQERKALRTLLPLRSPSEGRAVLTTPGLERAGGHDAVAADMERDGSWYVPELQRRHVANNDGLVVLGATSQVFRMWATRLITMASRTFEDMSYDELTWPETTGEVQVFRDFHERASVAISAR